MQTDPVQARVAALEAAFVRIEGTRMQGLGLINPRLAVRALGFVRHGADAALAAGVLVTPWFINLMLLPLDEPAALRLPRPGAKQLQDWGGQSIEFIGAEEAGFGRYALCSLFSPVHEFADQAAALATAHEVLRTLAPAAPPAAAQPARRGFLFGRSAAGGRP